MVAGLTYLGFRPISLGTLENLWRKSLTHWRCVLSKSSAFFVSQPSPEQSHDHDPLRSNNFPAAILFDAYGTLFNVLSVADLAETFFPGNGLALSVLWRDKQIEYSRLVTTSNDGAHYVPFSTLTKAGLQYAPKRFALDLTADHEAALMNQYLHLAVYPEVREVLQSLRARGIVTGILSNGDPSMLDPLV